MMLSTREKELINHYRTARDYDRQRISIIIKEAAEVAARLMKMEGK